MEDVTKTMRDNIVKIRDREGKLEHLVEQGERLEGEASQYMLHLQHCAHIFTYLTVQHNKSRLFVALSDIGNNQKAHVVGFS